MPNIITKLYDDLSRIPATTVIAPDIEAWLYRRYGKLNSYWSKDFHFSFAYPKHYTVINVPDSAWATLYPADCLFAITLFLGEQSPATPVINISVEKTLHSDSITAFNQHLLRLKQAGFSVDYRSDDLLKIVTCLLSRTGQMGEPVFSVQKYFVHLEHLYTITLGEIETKQMDRVSSVTGDIKQIVSSFSFTNA